MTPPPAGSEAQAEAGVTRTLAARRALPSGAALRRGTDVLIALTKSDLRARYGRGRDRVIKWMLDPFALVGVYLLMTAFVLERDWKAPGLSLACAVVPFQLVMLATIAGLTCIPLRGTIVLNMPFPRTLIPVSSALTEIAAFGASLFLVALMMVIYSVPPTVAIVWLPLIMLVNLAVAIGLAFPAALLGLWFPDLRAFAINCARALFFVAPGVVPLAEIHPDTQKWLEINPFTGLFEAYRDVFLYGQSPAAWELLYPLAAAGLLLAVFLPVFRREAQDFAKVLG
jgi:ABC-type polysaccharide/polyol phosphate export permease